MGKHTERLELIAIDKLIPYANNARTHSDEQIKKIQASLREFGFVNPVLIDKDCGIIAGHGRVEAAKREGMKDIPCVWVEHLTDAQKKAYILADNRLALDAGWDMDVLKVELEELKEINFDIDLTGFNSDELSDIFGEEEPEIAEDDYEVDLPEEPKAKLGDIYQLKNHRLMCGDSTDKATVEKLMDGNKADMVFTDPPYNVDYSNADRPKPSKADLGKIKNDVMSEDDFICFLGEVYKRLDENTKEDSSFYIWYADKSTIAFYSALLETNIEFKQLLIWKKPMLLGRSKYQWAHEPCIFAVKGSPYFTDDRTKTTVWDFGGYDKSKNVHPTQKPLFLPSEALQNSSNKNDIVLDLFGGSGSTLIACERLNRNAYVMELEPQWVDVIINRWETLTGEKAVKL